ncbi:MAG: ABC transporter substrate-binding protein, partial [Lachnospiraceae bacterium]|nr:ABC transporter substrate-binding protein [Lachnospiraceae bacterium]
NLKKSIIYLSLICIVAGASSCKKKSDNANPTLKPVSDDNFVDVDSDEELPYEKISFKIGLLKDSSAVSFASLIDSTTQGTAANLYEFKFAKSEEELISLLNSKSIEACVVSCATAIREYATNKNIQLAAITSLSSACLVEKGSQLTSLEDVAGKTIYCAKECGSNDLAFKELLNTYGISADNNITFVYKNTTGEIIDLLNEEENAIAIIEEPFVTYATDNIENCHVAFDLPALWSERHNNSSIVSDVVLINKTFADNNSPSVDEFLNEYSFSCESAIANVTFTKDVLDSLNVFKKYDIQPGLVNTRIEYYDNESVNELVGNFLKILLDYKPDSINNVDSDFYYVHNVG